MSTRHANKTKPRATWPEIDRRSGKDRRVQDGNPPAGMRERRYAIEPRRPDVTELQLTDSQWGALSDAAPLDIKLD